MGVVLKIILLFCFLILPIIPPKKRIRQKTEEDNARERSSYGIDEDGNLALMGEEEKGLK